MAKLKWHQTGDRRMEAGVKDVILFPKTSSGYDTGVAWNGVTAINENPSGADETELYADNEKYASMRSAEKFGFTIEAYTYPDEWMECDGSKAPANAAGVYFGQQGRKAFGLAYRTEIGSAENPGMDAGYKLHLIYNSTASPSSRSYTTINDNPDALSFSWEASSTPEPVTTTGFKGVCEITIDSTKVDETKLTAFINTLYGTDGATSSEEGTDSTLPLPDAVINAFKTGT